MTSFTVLKLVSALRQSGVLRLTPIEFIGLINSLWHCGNSYAGLAAIAAMRFPNESAIYDEAGTLTFQELQVQSDALALHLSQQHRMSSGQQAAILCRNHRGFVLAILALSRLGVDILLLAPDSPASSLRRSFENQKPDLLIYDPDFAQTITDAALDISRHCIEAESVRQLPRVDRNALPRVTRTSQLLLLTSGSTGTPKRIRNRPRLAGLLPVFANLLEELPIKMHQPAVLAIPLYHGYGLATLATTLALAAPLHLARSFEIAPLLARLPADAGAVLVSVPTLLNRWIRQDQLPQKDCLSAIITGSAPLDPALCLGILDAYGPVLFNLYGSTEAGVMCLASPQELREVPGTVGRPLASTHLRLLDDNGDPLATERISSASPQSPPIGRISVSGPLVLNPDQNGWFDTGDLGLFDSQGLLFVVGRSDNMFVSGGENVYPEETERTLASHPAVLDAAITIVADAEFGKSMVAWVVPRPGEVIDEATTRTWLRERLERYKVPRRVKQISAIPRNTLGKVDRKALAALEDS